MTTLIHFPGTQGATVQGFPNVAEATKVATDLPAGPRFILGEVTAKSMGLIPVALLRRLDVAITGRTAPEKTTKADFIERLLPLIPAAAAANPSSTTESETMSETAQDTEAPTKGRKGSKAKATKAVTAAKAKSAKAANGKAKTTTKAKAKTTRGRPSSLAGKKLTKVKDHPNVARMRAGSRRAVAWNAIKDGMLYETALAAGAHKDDIADMIKQGVLTAK